MPRHYPIELRRRTCERMLAGEAVKELEAELKAVKLASALFKEGAADPKASSRLSDD